MSKLSRDDVLKLARLARLDLTEEEVDLFREQLGDILTYAERLAQVEANDLPPTTQVSGCTNVMREDQVIDYGVSPEELLRLAPHVQDAHIKVKRMIT